jgi:outer membrane cobalamin receptor
LNKLPYVLVFSIICVARITFSQQTASDSVVTEEILVTANRIKTTPLLSPNKIQVLNKEFISSINSGKLSDALSYADAVFVKDYGFNSGLKMISLNSTQSEQTLILLDGVELNSKQNSEFDLSLIQLDEISRIEISKGGSSSLYGAEAIGGVINIISEKTPIRNLSFELKANAGSYGFKKIFLKGSQYLKALSYNLSYSYETSRNNYDYNFNQGSGVIKKQRENSEYYTHAVKFNSSLNLSKNSMLDIFSYYSYWNRGIPGVELGYTPSDSKQIDRDFIASLAYKKTISGKNEFKTSAYYKYSLMSYYDLLINSFYKLNTFVHNSEYKSPVSNSIYLDAGSEIGYSNILSNEIEYGKSFQTGLYTLLKIEPSPEVTLYPSVRYDYYSDINKKIITSKLGVNVKPFRRINFSVKSSIGNNFREPSFNELFWVNLGNKNLRPEKSVSFDAGVYYDFNLISKNTFEVSYYDINTIDRILWQPDFSGIWHPTNVGKVSSEGIDISLRSNAELFRRLTALLTLNYNYGKSLKKNQNFPGDKTYLKQLIYLPQEYFKSAFMLNYLTTSKFLKSVSLNVFYAFTGKRYADPENTRFVPYYDLIDINVCFNLNLLKSDMSLKFAVNNLTNTNYQVVSGYPMPLRNYKFELGFKY